MPDQRGFGATERSPPGLSVGQGDYHMNKYDEEVTHPGNRISTLNPRNSPWTGSGSTACSLAHLSSGRPFEHDRERTCNHQQSA